MEKQNIINEEIFVTLCGLSKINFSGEEAEKVKNGLNKKITGLSRIKTLNISYTDKNEQSAIRLADLREDVKEGSFPAEVLMRNTVSRDSCYIVPKVME